MALRRSSKWCGPGPFRGLCQRAGGRRTGATGNVTGLELAEVELVASDAEVFDDVRDDATWHIAGMPGKGDEPVGSERIGAVPVAAELLTRCMSLEKHGICLSPFPVPPHPVPFP